METESYNGMDIPLLYRREGVNTYQMAYGIFLDQNEACFAPYSQWKHAEVIAFFWKENYERNGTPKSKPLTATEATARTEELQHESQCTCGLHWRTTETNFTKGVLCDCGRVSKVVSGLAMFKVEWENRPPVPCSKCESQSPNGSEFATASTGPCFPESMLQEAERLTNGDRREMYGSAVDNFRGIADAFNAATGHHITPAQVGLFNLIQKICREGHAHKRDNLVDIAGYAKLVQQVHDYSATK